MHEIVKPIHAAVNHVARAQIRIPGFCRARIRREGQPDLKIRIGNLSRSGFMGEASETLRAGMAIQLVMPFGKIMSGTVRWSLNGRFGCQLDNSFSGRQMLAMAALGGARFNSVQLLVALLILAALL